ncbi:MAG: serine hydrolase [Desulfobacterales bacterium]|nr:serine hydrolase [Desulfobacterales bacterium]
MKTINNLMKKGIYDGVFPGGVVLVSSKYDIIFFEAYGYANICTKQPMLKDTVFDLASLTKPVATTLAIIKLIQDAKLSLEQEIKYILPVFSDSSKGKIKIENLLLHNSGLPAHKPYYRILRNLTFINSRNILRIFLTKESLLHPIGKEVLYSDLGFMILSWIVESISGERLDNFVKNRIYEPLCINNIFFISTESNFDKKKEIAATEICPWRKKILQGDVHDDNAYSVGGIEGHAGIFGNAYDLHLLLSELLSSYHGYSMKNIFEKDLIEYFFKRRIPENRALGFDCPTFIGSSAGRYFSKETVGHLGFTGTSFWIDLKKEIIVILLTNRVHPTRLNNRIKSFRPIFHDAVMGSLL